MFVKEKISIARAKYLLSIGDDGLKDLIRTDYEDNGEKSIWSPETYFKRMKQWLNLMVKFHNGEKTVEYKYSKTLVNCGRLYSDGFGVQSLQRQFRAFLTQEFYNDFDMINAHPTILLYLTKKYFSNTQVPFLESYVKNRKEFLKKNKITKVQVLVCINSKNAIKTNNITVSKFDKELKTIQTLFFDKTPNELKKYEGFKYNNKKNPKGGFLNTLLTIVENDILNAVINNFDKEDVSTLMFDGLHLKKDLDIQKTVKKLNSLTSVFNIKWSHKIPEENITLDEGIVINEDEFHKDYKSIKPIFERTNCMIQNPLSYINEWNDNGEKKFSIKNKTDFKDLNNHFMCEKIVKGSVQEVEFFNLWIKDTEKRSYQKLDFIPKKINDKNIYNTFNGFNFDEFNDSNETIDIEPFIKHIGILVNNEEQSINYILNYLSHLIQKPYELPRVCLLFKSKQGYGKDLFINFLEKLLGKQYIGRTCDIDKEVFGDFNPMLKNNLVLQLNELEGKHGFENKEKLKNLITAEQISINDKNEKLYKQSNYSRVIICSNNLTPIEIPSDDRRFVVFQAQDKKPSKEYFNKIVNCLNNDLFIYSLYKFLKNRPISDLNLANDRPITNAYNIIQRSCNNTFYEYLNDLTYNYEDIKDSYPVDVLINRNTKTLLIPPSILTKHYKSFLYNNSYDFKIKSNYINSMILNLDINKTEKVINGKRTRLYKIEIEKLILKMKALGIYTEAEILNPEEEGFE
tara:strand:+ start:181 stop:2403 length:2223 start_codon:yes stop_codon:yes gene_type:complete